MSAATTSKEFTGVSTAKAKRAPARRPRREGWISLRRQAASLLVLLIVVLPLIYVLLAPFVQLPAALRLEPTTWVRVFTAITLAFFPGWLFIRFISTRGPALWNEYVVNLHRLGVDDWKYLPPPPRNSEYYKRWAQARKSHHLPVKVARHRSRGRATDQARRDATIYQEKFDAYYGRGMSRTLAAARRVNTETLFPLFLLTAALAVGWTAILYGGRFLTEPADALPDVLAYGFAGAYLFNLQTLIRRFFQADLKASAYASAFNRMVTVLIIVTVIHQLPLMHVQYEAATAFIIGFFPLAGLQAVRRIASKGLHAAVPSLQSNYPLSELDGLNLWYETRLVEEGIEDIQELVSASIVDVLLHTRVPVARLVDWLDQAHLILQLPAPKRLDSTAESKQSEDQQTRTPLRAVLRRAGIRTATDLLEAFGVYRPVQGWALADASRGGAASPQAARWQLPSADPNLLADWLAGESREDPVAIHALVTVIANQPALTPVLNWREWGSQRMFELQTGAAHRSHPRSRPPAAERAQQTNTDAHDQARANGAPPTTGSRTLNHVEREGHPDESAAVA